MSDTLGATVPTLLARLEKFLPSTVIQEMRLEQVLEMLAVLDPPVRPEPPVRSRISAGEVIVRALYAQDPQTTGTAAKGRFIELALIEAGWLPRA